MRVRNILILVFFLQSVALYAQTALDTLRSDYLDAKSDRQLAEGSLRLLKYYLNENLDSSSHYANLCLVHSTDLDNDSLIAITYMNMGNIGIYQGNLDVALENYFETLTRYEEDKYPAITQGVLNNIGIVFDRKKDYEKARDYFLKSQKYLEEKSIFLDDDIRLMRVGKLYLNIGNTYESEGNTNLAMEYYVKAMGIASEQKDLTQQAIIYSNFGTLNLNIGKADLAESNYKEAMKIYNQLEDNSGLARIYMHLGDVYSLTGDNEKGIEAFTLSIKLAEETHRASTAFYSSEGLYKLLAEKGDYENAFFELERTKILNDSLFNSEKIAALERLELEFEFQEEKRVLEEERRFRTTLNYALGSGIILVIVILMLSLRNYKNRSRLSKLINENLELSNNNLLIAKNSLEEKLTFKSKELTTNVMYLMKKNELINNVSDKLLAMRGQFKAVNQNQINRIILDLQKAAEDDVWAEFETHFNKVHSDFYDNLLRANPKLSLNERKLCAFIRLNLTTKEICAITNQTVNTLQVARTRLRKKLNLESNEMISAYLQNL